LFLRLAQSSPDPLYRFVAGASPNWSTHHDKHASIIALLNASLHTHAAVWADILNSDDVREITLEIGTEGRGRLSIQLGRDCNEELMRRAMKQMWDELSAGIVDNEEWLGLWNNGGRQLWEVFM
jgi:hypothetical protein